MRKKSESVRSRAKTPGRTLRDKAGDQQMNQATTEEFEREEMGIAPKE